MKITITMDCPSWREDDAFYCLESMMEEIKTDNFYKSHDAQITSFVADGTDYMNGYEAPEYVIEEGESPPKGRLAGSKKVWGPGV